MCSRAERRQERRPRHAEKKVRPVHFESGQVWDGKGHVNLGDDARTGQGQGASRTIRTVYAGRPVSAFSPYRRLRRPVGLRTAYVPY
jgi:hypothetical protein